MGTASEILASKMFKLSGWHGVSSISSWHRPSSCLICLCSCHMSEPLMSHVRETLIHVPFPECSLVGVLPSSKLDGLGGPGPSQ